MCVGDGGFHEVIRPEEVSEILVLENLENSGPSRAFLQGLDGSVCWVLGLM